MAPLISFSNNLIKRDASNLSAGAIAGIIVGIVVVALILLGLFIWRLLHYRNTFGPYTARGRESSAKNKASAQTRGDHVRSTRLRDPDVAGFDEKTGLVGAKPQNVEDPEVNEGSRPSPIVEDDRSLNGTVGEEYDDVAAAKNKQAQQQIDYEIYQGHHAGPAPAFVPVQIDEQDSAPIDEFNAHSSRQEQASSDQKRTTKGSIRQGCTTM